MASSGWDWVFTASAWLLAALAAALVLWCLLWDRARGRRRCPKCWYDMSGSGERGDWCGELVCPECGKTIADERKLRKTRRRWRLALLSLPMLLSAHAVSKGPVVRERGWRAGLPTSALVLAAPEDELSAWFNMTVARPWMAEIIERQDELAMWQRRVIASRTRAIDPGHVVRAYELADMAALDSTRGRSVYLVLSRVIDVISTSQRSAPARSTLRVVYRELGDAWLIATEPDVQADYARVLGLLRNDPEACAVVRLDSIKLAAAFVPPDDELGAETIRLATERAFPAPGVVHMVACAGGRVYIGDEAYIELMAQALREAMSETGR